MILSYDMQLMWFQRKILCCCASRFLWKATNGLFRHKNPLAVWNKDQPFPSWRGIRWFRCKIRSYSTDMHII